MSFQPISHDALDGVFKLIGKDWMLVTAKKPDGTANTMTASWGGLGILWNKPVAFVFIRPQRHTYTFTEEAKGLTLSFFTEKYRKALQLCGSKSGRDMDKFAAAGLTLLEQSGAPVIEQARLNLVCRKLYTDVLKEECFVDSTLLENYQQKDYHRLYVVEIEEILESVEE